MRTLLFLTALSLSACNCGNGTPGGGGGGGGGGSGGSGGAGGGVSGGCGQYATLCGGVCLQTVSDPANCGACGHPCAGTEVCTSATCQPTSACPVGLTACNGRCVDLLSSNLDCGSCAATAACPSGKACSAGSCITPIALDGGGPANCVGGGPPVFVGPSAGSQQCTGTLAQVTFRWGLCSCSGVSTGARLRTDGFSSNQGPVDGGLGGSVGANGNYSASSAFDVGGALWTKGSLSTSAVSKVRQELHVDGTCNAGGTGVGEDAFVTGDVTGLAVTGKLFVPASAQVAPNVTATGGVVRGAVTVPAPCDCDPSQLLDLKAIIDQGKAVNDNASIGLNPNAIGNLTGATRLDLPCGRYFLKAISVAFPVTIAVHGRTVLFIEDNVNVAADLAFFLDPGAELDVFIGGDVSASGAVRFGDPQAPAQSRFYIGGGFSTSTGGSIAGNFYLPKSAFVTSGAYTVYGSIFAGSLNASAALDLHYDRAILNAGSQCGLDAGTPAGCNSCRDCGNQACVAGHCGACTDSSQCCAPLTCSNGSCIDAVIN